jgi:SpoVK/Ycf46/Vps4 family AAA+-type ATPase
MNSLTKFGTEIKGGDNLSSPTIGKSKETSIKEDGSFNYTQWTRLGDGVFTFTGPTQAILDPAVYTIFQNERGIFFRKEHLSTDDLIEFKDSESAQILKEIETFWNSKKYFDEYGFLHKRGYLFFGQAGCGKSGLISIIISKIIKRGGIVLMANCHPKELTLMIKMIRQIEPSRHVVTVFEDIDALIQEYGESQILSFLDGEAQTGDILNIATTNYPERLDKRIVSRPRRFDRRIEIYPPTESMREEFFMKKLGIDKAEVKQWVDATKNFPFAALTDLVIQVKCLNIPFKTAVERLHILINGALPSSDDHGAQVGFGNDE